MCSVYVRITFLLINWLSFISLLCFLVIYVWFTQHVIYLISIKHLDKKHRVVLNQNCSFTPFYWTQHGVRRKIDMDRLEPSKPLNLDRNLLQNWKSWKQEFILFMAPTEYDEKPDNVKGSLLLCCIGEQAKEVYNTFNISTTANSIKLETIIEQFEVYFNPRRNITYFRFKFLVIFRTVFRWLYDWTKKFE